MTLRPRLRTVLLGINLLILVLPLASISVLRLYETELVRETESNLLSQGLVLSLVYRDRFLAYMTPNDKSDEPTSDLQKPMDSEPIQPLLPALDVARENLRQPIQDARNPDFPVDAAALAVGADMLSLIKEAQNATLAGIRIVDWRGTVVASTGIETGLNLANREDVARALKGESVSLLYQRTRPEDQEVAGPLERRTRYRVHVAMPVSHNGRILGAVVLMRTPLDVSKALYLHRKPLLIGVAVILAVVLIVTALTSVTINRPINRLIKQIEHLSRSEKDIQTGLEKPRTRELEQLSAAFTEMAQKLEKRSEYIQTFVANVSHAFKTPLASTRAAVELLKDHLMDMTPEERNRFLSIIENDAARLERLVRRLTELAKADVAAARGDMTSIPEVLDDLAERYASLGLPVSVEHDRRIETVAMDRETFESIMTNLLDNARQHGGPDVEVSITTRIDAKGMIELSVYDTGPGISEANAARIFRPFFTTAKEGGGTGLGLPIVDSLLKAHGGSITLESSTSGVCFRISLPVESPQHDHSDLKSGSR